MSKNSVVGKTTLRGGTKGGQQSREERKIISRGQEEKEVSQREKGGRADRKGNREERKPRWQEKTQGQRVKSGTVTMGGGEGGGGLCVI